MTVVYFTRSKYLTLPAEYRETLKKNHNFPIPGPEWELEKGIKREPQKELEPQVIMHGSVKRQRGEEVAEDVVDEEEELDQQLSRAEVQQWRAKDWANKFKNHIQLWLGNKDVGQLTLGVVTSCTGITPILALEQILPAGSHQVSAMVDKAYAKDSL